MAIPIEDATYGRRMTAAALFTPRANRVFRVFGILSTLALMLIITVCSYRMGYAHGSSDARPIVAGRGLYRWLAIEDSRTNDAEQRPIDAPSRLGTSVSASLTVDSYRSVRETAPQRP